VLLAAVLSLAALLALALALVAARLIVPSLNRFVEDIDAAAAGELEIEFDAKSAIWELRALAVGLNRMMEATQRSMVDEEETLAAKVKELRDHEKDR
jgi:methyl-accepting chemotaxis protein